MSDVFISYSKADKSIAEELADDLRVQNLDVWWDFELYAGQDFQQTILEALDASKVAVVIWSPTAVKSSWVRDEAARAARANKLITTHAPGFDLQKIPLGMGLMQSVDVTDRSQIYKALTAHGLCMDALPPNKLNIPDDQLTDDELLDKYAIYRYGSENKYFIDAAKQLEAEFFDWKDSRPILDMIAGLHKYLCFMRMAVPMPSDEINKRMRNYAAQGMTLLYKDDMESARNRRFADFLRTLHKTLSPPPRTRHH